jgi:hypothetical protein
MSTYDRAVYDIGAFHNIIMYHTRYPLALFELMFQSLL